ncbi:PE family protein, partial [Mycobacterium tuberculosis]
MIATPAALTAAATDIDGIGSAVSVANAAAVAATTGVLAAGGDEVLAAIARLFNANAEEYH